MILNVAAWLAGVLATLLVVTLINMRHSEIVNDLWRVFLRVVTAYLVTAAIILGAATGFRLSRGINNKATQQEAKR